GVYYDQLLGYAVDTYKNAAPYYRIGNIPNFNSSCNGAPDATCTFPSALGALQTQGEFPLQGQILDYHDFKDTQAMRYEFGIQHPFPKQTNLQVSYVGARANHVWRNYEANLYSPPIYNADGSYYFPPGLTPINPAFRSGINVMASDAQSFYNSFLLTADTR